MAGLDVAGKWAKWATKKLAANGRLRRIQDNRQAATLALAKATGKPQILRSCDGVVDDGEGGECYGTTAILLHPDGHVSTKIIDRAY